MANGKYLPANNPSRMKRDERIISLSLQGLSQAEIEKKVGVSKPTISRVLSGNCDERIRERHTEALRRMGYEFIPIAMNNLSEFLKGEHGPELTWKATEKTLQATDVLASHTQSPLSVRIYNDNRQISTTDSSEFREFLDWKLSKARELQATTDQPIDGEREPVIDVESTRYSDQGDATDAE